MGNPYTASSISGYNSNPPADDGSQIASNQITWAKHKTKLGDPLKTLAESINSNVSTAFGKIFGNAVNSQSTTYQVLSSDQGKVISVTNTVTVTLVLASTAGSNFTLAVVNAGTGTVTLEGSGSETINGALNVTLAPQEFVIVSCDGSNWTGLGGIPQTDIPLPRSYFAGLGTSNGSTPDEQVDIAVGECRDDSNAANIRVTSTLTIDITGTGANGLDTGAAGNNLWYDAYVIRKSSDGTVASLAVLEGGAPSYPTGYDQKRRVGKFRTDGTADIITYIQRGPHFYWVDPATNGLNNTTATSTTGSTVVLPYSPPNCDSDLSVAVTGSESADVWLYPTDVTSAAVARTTSMLSNVGGAFNNASAAADNQSQIRIFVDANQTIGHRASTLKDFRTQTMGWYDRRGVDD